MLQSQGLHHNTSLSQILYDINYYITRKYFDAWKYFALESVENESDEFTKLPVSVRGKFKAICKTRWLSGERQCHKLVELLEVKASTSLVNFVKDQMLNENQWQELLKTCCCMFSHDQPSHLLLCAYYITSLIIPQVVMI